MIDNPFDTVIYLRLETQMQPNSAKLYYMLVVKLGEIRKVRLPGVFEKNLHQNTKSDAVRL